MDIKFGMEVVKYTQTSFDRQVRESVLIQEERNHHSLLNSRTEYNRCSLPRLCTQIGESEYKKHGDELESEKKLEERIEAKIRILRKEKNKARLHPTKEGGPSKKKRKIEKNEYITIEQVWQKPEVTAAKKTTRTTTENTTNKRTKLEDPSVPTSTTEPSKGWHTSKNLASQGVPEPWDKNHQVRNTTIVQGEDWGEDITLDENWDEKIALHRNELEVKENTRKELSKQNNNEETSWELYDLCKDYLEKNSTDWAKRK